MPFEITFDTPQSMNADFEAEEPMLAEFQLGGGGGGGGSGLTDEIKQALLTIAEKVAYIDEHGQTYYQALYDALYPAATMFSVTNTLVGCFNSNAAATVAEGASYSGTITADAGYSLTGATVSITMGGVDITASAYNNGVISIASVTGNIVITISAMAVTLTSISAVFTQGQTVVYDTDSLDSLKPMLVVTATYSDSSTQTVPSADYTLSGTLTAGTSTITVSYGGQTATFSVTVTSHDDYPVNYTWLYKSKDNVLLSARTDLVDDVLTKGTPTEAITNTFLHVSTDTSTTGSYLQYNLKPTSSTNAVLTAKVRCNELPSFINTFVGLRLIVSNGTSGATFAVNKTSIKYAEGTSYKTVQFPDWYDFTEWHIYKVELTSDGKQIGYIDDTKIFESSTLCTSYTTVDRLAFIASSSNLVDCDVEWVAFWDRSAT